MAGVLFFKDREKTNRSEATRVFAKMSDSGNAGVAAVHGDRLSQERIHGELSAGAGINGLTPAATAQTGVAYEGPGESRPREQLSMIFMLSPYEITPNPSQPRRVFGDEAISRLADSIRLHGIIQPLAVRRPTNRGCYELVAGERRLRAAKLRGLPQVPCIMVEADSQESAHLAIIENIQRENLNMFEQAAAISSLMQIHCLTQEKIAAQLSCSQSYVANKLRLLRIGQEDRQEIIQGGLTERHARALLRIKDPDKRRAAMRTMIRRSMNVAAAEEYVDKLLSGPQEHDRVNRGGRDIKLVVKDVRLFMNTIDRAVETMRTSGFPVVTSRRDNGEDTAILIRIPNGGLNSRAS